LFYGDASQFFAQCIGVFSNIIYVGLVSFAVFKLIEVIFGHRPEPEAEIYGLDIPEMGVAGYSGVKLDRHSETPIAR